MTILQLLTNEPLGKDYYNKNLIKRYKSNFFIEITKDINWEKLLFDILDNDIYIYQREYYIPLYLPIKNLKAYESNEIIDVEYFDLKNFSKKNRRIEMFINFIDWLEDKNVNYQYLDNNNITLIEKLVVRLMQWNDKNLNKWFMTNGLIISKIENLNEIQKINLFTIILDNWSEIWNKNNKDELKSHYLYSKYNDPYPIFQTLQCLSEQLKFTKINRLNENYKKFINDITEFQNSSKVVDNICNLQFNILLNSILKEKIINKKQRKI